MWCLPFMIIVSMIYFSIIWKNEAFLGTIFMLMRNYIIRFFVKLVFKLLLKRESPVNMCLVQMIRIRKSIKTIVKENSGLVFFILKKKELIFLWNSNKIYAGDNWTIANYKLKTMSLRRGIMLDRMNIIQYCNAIVWDKFVIHTYMTLNSYNLRLSSFL